MPVLYVSELGHERIYPVETDEVNIGREESNQVFLKHIEVSRRHCALKKSGTGYVLHDFSQNGVLVNGHLVTGESPLKDGDVIQVGKAVLAYLDRSGVPLVPMQRSTSKKIGEICLEKGYLRDEQLQAALAEQQKAGGKLGDILLGRGFLSKSQLMDALVEQLNTPWIDLSKYELNAQTVSLFPKAKAKEWCAIPVFHYQEVRKLTVAMADPSQFHVIQEMEFYTYCNVEAMLAPKEDILAAIDKFYPSLDLAAHELSREALQDLGASAGPATEAAPASTEDDRALSKLVNAIIEEAIRRSASDIHIEASRTDGRVRYRIDGILLTVRRLPKALYGSIVNRVKILANMDIAERRFPQDGRATIAFEKRETDLRVSTFPSTKGEKVVIRLLSKTLGKSGFDELGMGDDAKIPFLSILRRSEGLILVVGPTGSGKTSTLYTVINLLANEDKSFITLEDPVELELEGVCQAQIYDHPRFTFASGLRAALRQDPNVLLVGEIRDKETAQIAIQAALTGHLVFSTLHSNSAASTFPRLMDMGVEPYLITASVLGVLSQRLVRVLCPKCRRPTTPAPEVVEECFHGTDVSGVTFFGPVGCNHCHGGYRGRTGVFEFLLCDEEINRMVARNATAGEIRLKAQEKGMMTLRDDALRKAISGVTTLDEVLRVAYVGV